MICVISHFEIIKERDGRRILNQIIPLLLWNLNCISKFKNIDYKIICNDMTETLLCDQFSNYLVNVNYLNASNNNNLYKQYISSGISNKLNYGIDFEFKCFERFFLINNFIKKSNYDVVLHVDCDLAFSKISLDRIQKFIKSYPLGDKDVIALNNYSTFFSCFSKNSISNFCKFIESEYLGFKPLKIFDYRISDMGALDQAFKEHCLNKINLFDDLNKNFISPDLSSFQPLAIEIFNNINNFNGKNWWNMSDVSDNDIIAVADSPLFFKFDFDNYTIYRDKIETNVVHFHGPTKRFINFCLKNN
jgi:hypothetical protein